MVAGPFPVTVGTTAVVQLTSYNKDRTSIIISPTTALSTIYVSTAPNVSTATGTPIKQGANGCVAAVFGSDPRLIYYAISDTASTDVRVTEGFMPVMEVTK